MKELLLMISKNNLSHRRRKEWQIFGINSRNVKPCVLADPRPSKIRTKITAFLPLRRPHQATQINSLCLHPSPIPRTSTRAKANWAETIATTAGYPSCINDSRLPIGWISRKQVVSVNLLFMNSLFIFKLIPFGFLTFLVTSYLFTFWVTKTYLSKYFY